MSVLETHPELVRVYDFAKDAHGDQKRKFTGEPYITHPLAVCEFVSTVTSDIVTLSVALLHDVVEDTDVTLSTLIDEFGSDIAVGVWWVTDVSKPTDGNRRFRKDLDALHVAGAPEGPQTVKAADITHNLTSIIQSAPKFAVKYVPEKERVLDVLVRADATVRQLAYDRVAVYNEYRV